MTNNIITPELTPVLRTIGDLDSPNWGDERDRTVHLEASAVARQVQTYMGLAVAAVMPWVLGRSGLWWGLAVLSATSVGNVCYMRYTTARGVTCDSVLATRDFKRAALLLAIVAVFLLGVVVRVPEIGSETGTFSPGNIITYAIAFAFGIGIVVGIKQGVRKRHTDADIPDDVFGAD